LDVLLLSGAGDFESVLPTLDSFAQSVRHAPLTDYADRNLDRVIPRDADVAIIDARSNLTMARTVCRRLAADAPALAVVAVVTPADFVAIDVDWNFDDVLLAAAGAAELQARLRLSIARRRSALEGTLKFDALILHPASFTASVSGKELGLTLTEFKLLNFLVQHAGQAFSRTRLMHEVWGYDCDGRVRTVDVHVGRLRAKLGAEYESMVDTVRGVGYMVVTPPQPQWIISEPKLSPMWTSTVPTAHDSVVQ
jgi:DNA-binding response OmpR family regulator